MLLRAFKGSESLDIKGIERALKDVYRPIKRRLSTH